MKTCCFIGHRKIKISENLIAQIKLKIEEMIMCEGIDTFLFGNRSEFTDLCLQIITELKKIYPHLIRIYVRAKYLEIPDFYEAYLLESCDKTYFADKANGAGRLAYVQRDRQMIDQSDICIFFYNENYLPPKKHSRHYGDTQPQSGTKLAFEYASKKKRIINIFENGKTNFSDSALGVDNKNYKEGN